MTATMTMVASPSSQAEIDVIKTFSNPGPGYSLECDYDANPSFLYQALEAKQWDYALKFFGKPEGFVQAATWVTRKEKNGMLRWRILPIHASIIFGAPVVVIEKLVKEFPAGVQQKDDQGMLPIHLAFRNNTSCAVLEELLTAFPQGLSVKDRKGRSPVQCAQGSSKAMAALLDLYGQIVLSNERQQTVAESRTVIDTRIAGIQEQHIDTLTKLKEEWEVQHETMEKEVEDAKKALELTALRLQETQVQLAQKSKLENELTHKLGMVTMALQSVNSSRATESGDGPFNSPRSPSRHIGSPDDAQLREANEELFNLAKTLLNQQISLKARLDNEALAFENKANQKVTLLKELDQIHRSEVKQTSNERDMLRSNLGESNETASRKLKAVMQMMSFQVSPPVSPRSMNSWF